MNVESWSSTVDSKCMRLFRGFENDIVMADLVLEGMLQTLLKYLD